MGHRNFPYTMSQLAGKKEEGWRGTLQEMPGKNPTYRKALSLQHATHSVQNLTWSDHEVENCTKENHKKTINTVLSDESVRCPSYEQRGAQVPTGINPFINTRFTLKQILGLYCIGLSSVGLGTIRTEVVTPSGVITASILSPSEKSLADFPLSPGMGIRDISPSAFLTSNTFGSTAVTSASKTPPGPESMGAVTASSSFSAYRWAPDPKEKTRSDTGKTKKLNILTSFMT
jgi:hypothetical protein